MSRSIRFQEAIRQLGMADQRHAPRHRCDLAAHLTPLGVSDPARLVNVVDISGGGAKILTRFPVQIGQCVQIDLCSDQWPGPQTLQIQHVLSISRGELLLGGEWLRQLDAALVQALVDERQIRPTI